MPGGVPGSGLSPAQWLISIGNGGASDGATVNGVGADTASVGTTSQSATMVLPQFNESFEFSASASNALIPSSILQSFSLDNIPLSVSFSLTGAPNSFCSFAGCDFDVSGELTSGNVSVDYIPPTTPLPASLPLFATGLGALGLIGWRRRQKYSRGRCV